MIDTIKRSKEINKNFDKLSTQQQWEFIIKYVDANVMKEELVWYYDSLFGCPYDTLTLQRKNANTNQFKSIG